MSHSSPFVGVEESSNIEVFRRGGVDKLKLKVSYILDGGAHGWDHISIADSFVTGSWTPWSIFEVFCFEVV